MSMYNVNRVADFMRNTRRPRLRARARRRFRHARWCQSSFAPSAAGHLREQVLRSLVTIVTADQNCSKAGEALWRRRAPVSMGQTLQPIERITEWINEQGPNTGAGGERTARRQPYPRYPPLFQRLQRLMELPLNRKI